MQDMRSTIRLKRTRSQRVTCCQMHRLSPNQYIQPATGYRIQSQLSTQGLSLVVTVSQAGGTDRVISIMSGDGRIETLSQKIWEG